ncbi:MAG: hypothetical protein ACLQU4_18375 [Limisphaerales bacterium]
MIRLFKELYLTGFTIGFRLRMPERLGGGWGPIIDAGKGVALLSIIALINLTNIMDWIEVYGGTKFSFDSSRWAQCAIALVFYFANYYILVTCGHGIKFEREEFKNLKKSRKVLLIVSFAVLLLITIVFSIYSTSAYQHFFHIVPKSDF